MFHYGGKYLHKLYLCCPGDKIEKNRWVGHVGYMGERRDLYRVLVGKPEGKRPFGSLRSRWEDNIKEVGCRGMDWIGTYCGHL
jgi:hypothetical protein